MSHTLIRYLLGRTFIYLLAITAIGLTILLLERSLNLTQRVSDWGNAFGVIVRMLATMIPEYLGLALPAALFFSVLLTFGSLSRNSELAVLHSVGLGLRNLMRPLFAFSLLVTLIAALLIGFAQPYGRYAYRMLMHLIADASVSALVRSGAFVHVDDMTVLVDQVSPSSGTLANIFVEERKKGGGTVVTTARQGFFKRADDGATLILGLQNGIRTELSADGSVAGVLTFDQYRWPIDAMDDWGVRPRGKDERELTLTELWSARDSPPYDATRESIQAELHGRLVRILSIPFLPLLAVPLGLGGGRRGQAYGVGIGLVLLIVYEQTLHFTEALATLGKLSPLIGLWIPWAILAISSVILFRRANAGVPDSPLAPLHVLADRIGRQGAAIAGRLRRSRRPAE